MSIGFAELLSFEVSHWREEVKKSLCYPSVSKLKCKLCVCNNKKNKSLDILFYLLNDKVMNNNSRETVFERAYGERDQKILNHVKNDVSNQHLFFTKLNLLKLQQNKIAEILEKQKQEEVKFTEEKRQANFGDDPVYQKAKASWDEELLQKFHARSLTRYEYVEAAKKFGIDLWIDYYYQSLERFDQVSDFKDGFAPVKKGKKRGFINEQWEEICEAMYDFVSYFENGFASVKIGKKRGFINTKWEFFDKLPQ